MGFFDIFRKEKKEQLDKGLEKTRVNLFGRISKALLGKSTVDAAFLDELEDILISADVGVKTTLDIINRIEKRVGTEKYTGEAELNKMLQEEIGELLDSNTPTALMDFDLNLAPKPYIVLVVGVNGVGKTTTIGKLAHQYKQAGKKVILGAADTFRAAAVEQLKIWGTRTGVDVVDMGMNTDPSAVAFETAKRAIAEGADVAIIDTAGRLHNKVGLMNELGKIHRVIDKACPGAPHEVLLVLDASTGQNAFEQARQFTEATKVNALALTKLDGTAKGGVAIGISNEFGIPVKYIGVGEGMDHLQIFDKKEFVASLFGEG